MVCAMPAPLLDPQSRPLLDPQSRYFRYESSAPLIINLGEKRTSELSQHGGGKQHDPRYRGSGRLLHGSGSWRKEPGAFSGASPWS